MAVIDINWSPPQRQVRQFCAIWFPAFWVVVCLLLWWRFQLSWNVIGTVFGSACGVAAISFAVPPLGRGLWRLWMGLAFPIGFVISHVAIGLVYYLVLTPLGLGMKLVGYDPMARSLDPDQPSYWEEREPAPAAKRYFRQY